MQVHKSLPKLPEGRLSRVQLERECPEIGERIAHLRGDTVETMLGDLRLRESNSEFVRQGTVLSIGLGLTTALIGLTAQSSGALVAGTLLGGTGLAAHLLTRLHASRLVELKAEFNAAITQTHRQLLSKTGETLINRHFLESQTFKNPTQTLDASTGWEISRSIELNGLRIEQRGGKVTLDDGKRQTSFPGQLELPRPTHPSLKIIHRLEEPWSGLDRCELTIQPDGTKSLGMLGETEWDAEGIPWAPGCVYRHTESVNPTRNLWQPSAVDEITLYSTEGRVTLPSPVTLASLADTAPLQVSQAAKPMQPIFSD